MHHADSIIAQNDNTKPTNKLIEKISGAIGGIRNSFQHLSLAKDNNQSAEEQWALQMEVTELQARATRRFLAEEAKKQKNIEEITQKALLDVDAQANPEIIEDDWVSNFFDKCRLVSDQEMQTLWAKVLAGEANRPGKYSKRTVDFIASLDKSEAELFSKLCAFRVSLSRGYPLIYDLEATIYNHNGINFGSVSHLESIGLVKLDSLSGFILEINVKKGKVDYCGNQVLLEFPQKDKIEFQLGKVLLTKVGEELATLCETKPVVGFVEYLKEKWKGFGYKVDQPTSTENATTEQKS